MCSSNEIVFFSFFSKSRFRILQKAINTFLLFRRKSHTAIVTRCRRGQFCWPTFCPGWSSNSPRRSTCRRFLLGLFFCLFVCLFFFFIILILPSAAIIAFVNGTVVNVFFFVVFLKHIYAEIILESIGQLDRLACPLCLGVLSNRAILTLYLIHF